MFMLVHNSRLKETVLRSLFMVHVTTEERPMARVNSRKQNRWTPFMGCQCRHTSHIKVGAILIPISSCNESCGLFMGKSISSYSCQFVLYKILSSMWLSFMMDMLKSIVTCMVYYMLMHTLGTLSLIGCACPFLFNFFADSLKRN